MGITAAEWAECVQLWLFCVRWPQQEERGRVWYASFSNTKNFGITRLLFFTHLRFFSARCHRFTDRTVGDSSRFVHCQTVNMLSGVGLTSFRQRKALGLSLLVPGQILFVVRYYLSDDCFLFQVAIKKWLYLVFGYRVCSCICPEALSVFMLWVRAGFQEYPCICRKGTPILIA